MSFVVFAKISIRLPTVSPIFNFSKYCYWTCKHTQVLFSDERSFQVSERTSILTVDVRVVSCLRSQRSRWHGVCLVVQQTKNLFALDNLEKKKLFFRYISRQWQISNTKSYIKLRNSKKIKNTNFPLQLPLLTVVTEQLGPWARCWLKGRHWSLSLNVILKQKNIFKGKKNKFKSTETI